jgi:peptidoglycan/LPS O-acetylase OafA/YrhL
MRCRYHALLQIIGFLAVVAFHAEVPGMDHGWIAVELFFALAGYNMARMLQQRSTFKDYLVARYRRLSPPLLLLVPAVVLLIVLGSKSALTFVVSAPLQMHNLLRVTMTDWRETDMAWVPSWFLASLFQLQLLVFLVRGVLTHAHVLVVLAAAAGLGVSFRLGLGTVLQGAEGVLTFADADVLYWAPLTHVEAIVGGVQVGLGRLLVPRGGSRLGFVALAVGAALGVVALTVPLVSSEGPTFPLGQAGVGEHIWGYLALAAAAIVLVDKRHFLARWVLSWKLNPRVDAAIESLSRLTFLGYVLHGCVLAFLTRALQKAPFGLTLLQSAFGALAVSACVATLSLVLAAKLGQLTAFLADRRSPHSRA